MKILTSPQSGSYQGLTASRNRFGQYFRTKASPVQPRTPIQQNVRAWMAVGSSAWRSLTSAQRTAWNDYAAQILRTDSLGSSYSPTGAELFAGSMITGKFAAVSDPPATLPSYVLAITGMNYVGPTPGPEVLNVTVATTSSDNLLLAETSGPVSPGVTSAAAVRRWRTLPDSATSLIPRQFSFTASPVALLTYYNFLFPSPVSGQVIWFRFSEQFYSGGGGPPLTNSLKQTFRLEIP